MGSIQTEELLFKKYYKPLCHFAWGLLRDDESAKDVVQDAFMSLFDRKNKISSEEGVVRQFLYSSVKFACYNQLRHAKVDAKYMSSLPKLEDWYDDDLEYRFIRSEVLSEVFRIVESMPPGCKAVFKKGYLEGLTNKEIAEELNLSINTVKTQRQRGMKIIFNRLNPEILASILVVHQNL